MRDSDMVADFQFASDVKPPRLYWLWPGRIPLGRLTLLVGDPGLGKTLLAVDLAARVSAGLPWPDAPPPRPEAVEYCPEPLLPGDDDGCPLFNRKTAVPAPTGQVLEIENPDGTAVQVHAREESLGAPRGDAEEERTEAPDGSGTDPRQTWCERDSPTSGGMEMHDGSGMDSQGRDARRDSRTSGPTGADRRICRYAATADLLDCPYRLLPGSAEQVEIIYRRRSPRARLGVVFVSPEDPDSLTPRLAAAGADLQRICIVNGVSPRNRSARAIAPLKATHPHDRTLDDAIIVNPLRLPEHADVIVEAVNLFDHAALVIIDPLQAVLPAAGQSGPDGLAAALAALAEVARERDVAVVGIGHLAKARYLQTLYRVHGSVSLIGAARAAHLLSADPDQQDRRILFPIKTVYGKPPEPLACRIVSPGRLEWRTGESAAEGRAAYLSSEMLNVTAETHSALAEACDWLAAYLAAGPQMFRHVQRDALAAGICLATLRRAKRLIAARSIQLANHGGWLWSTEASEPRPGGSAAA